MLIALITITIILLVLMGRGKRAPRPIPPGLIRPAPPPGPPAPPLTGVTERLSCAFEWFERLFC